MDNNDIASLFFLFAKNFRVRQMCSVAWIVGLLIGSANTLLKKDTTLTGRIGSATCIISWHTRNTASLTRGTSGIESDESRQAWISLLPSISFKTSTRISTSADKNCQSPVACRQFNTDCWLACGIVELAYSIVELSYSIVELAKVLACRWVGIWFHGVVVVLTCSTSVDFPT